MSGVYIFTASLSHCASFCATDHHVTNRSQCKMFENKTLTYNIEVPGRKTTQSRVTHVHFTCKKSLTWSAVQCNLFYVILVYLILSRLHQLNKNPRYYYEISKPTRTLNGQLRLSNGDCVGR